MRYRCDPRALRMGSVPLAALVLLGAVACSPPDATGTAKAAPGESAQATDAGSTIDEGAVIAAHRALIQAFQKGDASAAAALMDPTSQLLVFHPYLENRFDGADHVREGLEQMFNKVHGLEWTDIEPEVRIVGDAAWFTSQVLVKSPELDVPFVGRGTEIWVRNGDQWRLAHGHWSQHARIASVTKDSAAN